MNCFHCVTPLVINLLEMAESIREKKELDRYLRINPFEGGGHAARVVSANLLSPRDG